MGGFPPQGNVLSKGDATGRVSFNTVFGDKIVVERSADIQEQFQYNVNTKTLTTTTVGSGAATQENSMLHISTGTDTNGSVSVQTKASIKYHPSFEGWSYFTALWDNGGVASSEQYIGPFSSDDGYFLGFKDTGFVVGRRNSGSDTRITSANFNGDPNFITDFDNTKINIFRITYGWLGTATITFEWKSPDKWIVIHQMRQENVDTVPNTTNPQLPISIDITKTAGATDIIMHSGSWGGGVNGPISHVGDRYFTKIVGPSTISTEAVLVNFQNVSTFQSKTNRVNIEGIRIGISTDGAKNAIVKIYKNLTITSPTWVNVDATNSVMQTDTVGTVTPSDANLLWAYPMAKIDTIIDPLLDIDFGLNPSDTLTITGQSAQTNDITFSNRWREHF